MPEIGEIYCISNTENNKLYIGQTKKGFLKRWSQHVTKANNDKLWKNHFRRKI